MKKFTKIILVLTIFFSLAHIALADRGARKKSKSRIILNINTAGTLRNSISFNLKNGLTYKGSLLSSQQMVGGSIMNSSIITYQKGNTIYIIPYKHKIAMPEMRQGYAGIKLIFQSHK